MDDLARLFSVIGEQSLRDAALAYGEAGLRVFPCVLGEKRPLTRRGFTEATTDQRRIARWWDRWPEANIGLPTGNGSVDVVDVDLHPSGSGFAALERARRVGLFNGWACAVRTPSGGLHFYYPADPGRPPSLRSRRCATPPPGPPKTRGPWSQRRCGSL